MFARYGSDSHAVANNRDFREFAKSSSRAAVPTAEDVESLRSDLKRAFDAGEVGSRDYSIITGMIEWLAKSVAARASGSPDPCCAERSVGGY